MSKIKIAPYGSWRSPITSDLIVSETVRISDVTLDGPNIYWAEMRPSESGRTVVVRWTPDRRTADITLAGFNVRTRVHEYGGRSFAVDNGTVYFSNYADQHVYCQAPHSDPVPIASGAGLRFADIIVDGRRCSLICVCEDHGNPNAEPENKLVRLDLTGKEQTAARSMTVLVSGSDFYASPSLSPDGSKLAWLTWRHPNMPWDGSELWVGRMRADGALTNREKVAGGTNESIFQPQWSPDGTLYFISDRSGWWNLYRRSQDQVSAVQLMEAEFGMPQWVFGMSTYGFASDSRLICAYTRNGSWQLAEIDLTTDALKVIETPYDDISYLRAGSGKAVFAGGAADRPASIVSIDLNDYSQAVLRRSSRVDIDAGFISSPQAVEFPTAQGKTAHAYFYAPCNKNYRAPEADRAPLVVISHGGPTAAATQSLNLAIQYWTSRGLAVLDVNYGGSTGYGREYRMRLNGRWGVVDTEDCVNGADFAAANLGVDRQRLIIRGSSAGGYTTLCALAFHDTFKAGASYYGVSDLEALARDTHKFEARYLDNLIGPYPTRKDLYVARSPIHHAEQLACPVIFFQGLEDEVVPPVQAEMMVAVLREKKLPVAYITFEKEQHGFRIAKNIKRALDAEFYFYSRIFDFRPADEIEPVEIENL